jgi:hypothetical protein
MIWLMFWAKVETATIKLARICHRLAAHATGSRRTGDPAADVGTDCRRPRDKPFAGGTAYPNMAVTSASPVPMVS